MSLEIFNRLERLDILIRTRSTGTPQELAKRLNMSERNLYHFLDVMKDLGAPIFYCKTRKSYYYSEKGHFSIRFKKAGEKNTFAMSEEHDVSLVKRLIDEMSEPEENILFSSEESRG